MIFAREYFAGKIQKWLDHFVIKSDIKKNIVVKFLSCSS